MHHPKLLFPAITLCPDAFVSLQYLRTTGSKGNAIGYGSAIFPVAMMCSYHWDVVGSVLAECGDADRSLKRNSVLEAGLVVTILSVE